MCEPKSVASTFGFKSDRSVPVFAFDPLSALNKHLLIFPTEGFCTVATVQTCYANTPRGVGFVRRMSEADRDFCCFVSAVASAVAFVSPHMLCAFSKMRALILVLSSCEPLARQSRGLGFVELPSSLTNCC